MDNESQNGQDARVEELWKSLHDGPIQPLDLEGLRKGLKKINHRECGCSTVELLTDPIRSSRKRHRLASRDLQSRRHKRRRTHRIFG